MPDTTALVNALSPDVALSNAERWEEHRARWETMIDAGVLPKHIKHAGQAVAIARFGQIYGKDPMWSIHNIHVVEGRCELSAAAMMGLILERARPNGDIVSPVSMTAERAAIQVQRRGLDPEPVVVEFTIEDAATFKNGKSNWNKFPTDMLWARCVSRVGRRLFPDVIQGAYVQGEMMDARGPEADDRPRFEITQLDELPSEPAQPPPQDTDPGEPPKGWQPGDGPTPTE